MLTRYVDPSSETGLPAVVTARFEEATRAAWRDFHPHSE